VSPTYRLYRAPAVTVSTPHGSVTRDRLADYVVEDGSGAALYDVGNLAGRAYFYALAVAESAVHAQIAADPTVTALSPELADPAALAAWLDAPALPLGPAAAVLSGDGFPVAWVRPDHTRRQVFAHAFRIWKLCAYATGDAATYPGAPAVFAAALAGTFGGLSAAQRQDFRAWLETGVGIDTTNVVIGTSRIEQVLNFAANNWPGLTPVPLGPAAF